MIRRQAALHRLEVALEDPQLYGANVLQGNPEVEAELAQGGIGEEVEASTRPTSTCSEHDKRSDMRCNYHSTAARTPGADNVLPLSPDTKRDPATPQFIARRTGRDNLELILTLLLKGPQGNFKRLRRCQVRRCPDGRNLFHFLAVTLEHHPLCQHFA